MHLLALPRRQVLPHLSALCLPQLMVTLVRLKLMIQICIPTNLGSRAIRLCSRSFSIGDEDAEDEGGGAEDTERVTADKPPGGAGGMAKHHNLGGHANSTWQT